jgi:hypothetical protein
MKPSDYIRKGWTQGAYARDSDGTPIYPKSIKAVCWCPVGAICAAYYDNPAKRIKTLYSLKSFVGESPAIWSDAPERTQQEVIDLLESIGE